MHHLEIKDLYVSYDKETVLKGVTLSSDKGEVVSLIGPSGSGKSTLLRALIGLTPPSQGQVLVGGEAIDYSSRKSLRTLREEMAIVFQQYNLFQNMTVLRNVSIAPVKIQKRARREPLESGGVGVDFRRFKLRLFDIRDIAMVDISHIDPFRASRDIGGIGLSGDFAQDPAIQPGPDLLTSMFDEPIPFRFGIGNSCPLIHIAQPDREDPQSVFREQLFGQFNRITFLILAVGKQYQGSMVVGLAQESIRCRPNGFSKP